jgi:hypothetical protein
MKDMVVSKVDEFTWSIYVDPHIRASMVLWCSRDKRIDSVMPDIMSKEKMTIGFSPRQESSERQEFMFAFEEELKQLLTKDKLDKGGIKQQVSLLNE